jgi:hypothetical protein
MTRGWAVRRLCFFLVKLSVSDQWLDRSIRALPSDLNSILM